MEINYEKAKKFNEQLEDMYSNKGYDLRSVFDIREFVGLTEMFENADYYITSALEKEEIEQHKEWELESFVEAYADSEVVIVDDRFKNPTSVVVKNFNELLGDTVALFPRIYNDCTAEIERCMIKGIGVDWNVMEYAFNAFVYKKDFFKDLSCGYVNEEIYKEDILPGLISEYDSITLKQFWEVRKMIREMWLY